LYYLLDPNYADAAAIAHYCYEELPFVDLDVARENMKRLPPLASRALLIEFDATIKQCKQWDIARADRQEGEAINTEIPTLFLHGGLDPVLPADDLDSHTATFSQSAKVIFPDIAHTVVGVHHCGMEFALAFIDKKLEFRDGLSCEL